MNTQAFRILVLCTGNSARSQIGEALIATRGALRSAGAGLVTAESAGSHPAVRVNPYATEVLKAHGIDWNERTPRSIDTFAGQHFDLVITVCDNARDACPYFPGASVQVHWGLPDPADVVGVAAAREAFAATFTALSARIDALMALPLETMSPSETSERVAAIHARLNA